MIGNPLALVGLLSIAVPILIHLLARRRSHVERFPTLRFIGTSRLNPTRRRRISDWPLLLVRVAIVAVAAIALSQPRLGSDGSSAPITSRVIIRDTSASVQRPVGAIADTASPNVDATLIETAYPSEAIDAAVAWLSTRTGLREIVLASDFQRSSIDSVALDVPPGIGLNPIVIPSPSTLLGADSARDLLVADQVQIPRFTRDDIRVLAGPTDIAGARAAWRAVGRALPTDTAGRIAIIYKGAAAADSLYRAAVPIDSAWMARIVASLNRDSTLLAAGTSATDKANTRADLDVVGQPSSAPAAVAGRNGDRLSLFVLADAGSLPSAALNAALVRATSPGIPAFELDTAHWSATDLARWRRQAQPTATSTSDASDARWFWLACLALIAFETWLRSRSRREAQAESTAPARERAA